MDIRSRLLGVKLGGKLNLLIPMREREDVSDYGGRRVVIRDEVRLPRELLRGPFRGTRGCLGSLAARAA